MTLATAILALAMLAQTESEVRGLVQKFNAAYLANDLPAYFSYYAPDVTLWFESGRADLAGYRKSWEKLIAEGGGIEQNDVTDLKVQVGPNGDTAVATYLVRVATRQRDGKVVREEAKETDVWFKRNAKWQIVHLHYNSRELP